jgi:Tol biopolymer transport system component/DNA-binding winged helix-turn-helix (wHTH) protein
MSIPTKSAGLMRFGTFEVDVLAGELRKSDRTVRIQEQPFRILLLLLERPGEIVSREHIIQQLWPDGTFVDYEHSVNTAIRKLREALGDDPDSPRFVQTIPRRGYRFVAPLNNLPVDHTAAPVSTERRKWMIVAALPIMMAVAAAFFYYFADAGRSPEQPVNVVPLTSLPGQEISPTFSPDGTQVAFGWDGENNGAGFDVYVKAVGADKPLRLTHHPAAGLGTAWSPDGRHIAISRVAGEYSGIFLVAPTGGPERKLASVNILQDSGAYVSWSPDSKRIAFVEFVTESGRSAWLQMFTLAIDSPNEPKALRTDCPGATAPAFSPRGDGLAFVCIEDFGHLGIRLLNLADGKARTLLSAPGFINGLAWSGDGQRILYSHQDTGGNSEFWQISVAHPQQRQKLSFGADGFTPTISFTANRLAYAQQSESVNIWRVRLGANGKSAGPLITSTRRQVLPNISPDGRKIAFTSDRSGHNEIWLCDADGTNALQLTFLKSSSGTPAGPQMEGKFSSILGMKDARTYMLSMPMVEFRAD